MGVGSFSIINNWVFFSFLLLWNTWSYAGKFRFCHKLALWSSNLSLPLRKRNLSFTHLKLNSWYHLHLHATCLQSTTLLINLICLPLYMRLTNFTRKTCYRVHTHNFLGSLSWRTHFIIDPVSFLLFGIFSNCFAIFINCF